MITPAESLNAAIFFLYLWLLEASFGATLGKAMVGIRVVQTTERNPLAALAIRNLLRVVDGLGFYLVGAVVAGCSRIHRRLGFYLQMTEVDGSWAPLCMREAEKAVAGDALNAAVFFTERYYERRSVRELIPLAAQLIFAGHTLNNYGIDGLEIIVCDSTGFRPLPMNSISRLQSRAAALDATISSSLFQVEEVGDTPDVVG